ncbi:hypothetical protein KKF34_07105 [Myxococcota bacterium]|nr:hypothetical protein [Myxococcota bacterium]
MKSFFNSGIIIASMILASCGGKSGKESEKKENGPGKSEPSMKAEMGSAKKDEAPVKKVDKKVDKKSSSKEIKELKKIGHFLDMWNDLYSKNEPVINKYQGMPIMALVTPVMGLVTSPQYDLLNSNNADGKFEGVLILAGKKAFVEKKGAILTFGYTYTLDKDKFGDSNKKGDVKVEQGKADLGKGYFSLKTWTERGGKKVAQSNYEFKKLADGSMIALVTTDSSFRNKRHQSFIFLHNGKAKYDFVVGKGKKGMEFKEVSFGPSGELNKDSALKLLNDSGFQLDKKGGIKDGNLVVDK